MSQQNRFHVLLLLLKKNGLDEGEWKSKRAHAVRGFESMRSCKQRAKA